MAQRGPYARISLVDRQRIVNAFRNGDNWKELARMMGLAKQTARNIVSTYVGTGRTDTMPKGGLRRIKLTQPLVERIMDFVNSYPTATLEQMRLHLLQGNDEAPNVSLTAISRALDGRLITLKLLREVPVDWNTNVTKEARRMHVQWLLDEGSQEHLLFMDEFGVNIWTARTHGRAPRGTPAVTVVNGQRGQNLTICLAISQQLGLVHFMLIEGGFKNEHFLQFVSELDELVEGTFVLISDGARAHLHVPGMHAGHQHRFLPAYSPFLNPAERAGSALKAELKRRLHVGGIQAEVADRQQAAAAGLTLHQHRMCILRREVELAMNCITDAKCMQWVNHSQTYFQRCLNVEDIMF